MACASVLADSWAVDGEEAVPAPSQVWNWKTFAVRGQLRFELGRLGRGRVGVPGPVSRALDRIDR